MITDLAINITQSIQTLLNGPDDPEMSEKMRSIIEKKLLPIQGKLSERKTVHQWLNEKGTPREENGKPVCLLRRLAIALAVHPPSHDPDDSLELKARLHLTEEDLKECLDHFHEFKMEAEDEIANLKLKLWENRP